jgi:dienelactone hydrolase
MRLRVLTMAAAAFAVACVRGHARDADAAESVSFRSASYRDFRQVLSGEAATDSVTVAATLSFPKEAKERYPAIVVVHTIGGYQESNEGWHAAAFRKAGFATLTYDSFAARAMSEAAVIGSASGPPLASAVADAFAALALLAQDPRIDADRIAIVGFSFGGEVAHLTAMTRLHARLGPRQRRFAAHLAYYPAGIYGAVAEPGAYTGAPILMLFGQEDDNLPVAKVDAYVAYARGAGYPAPIDTVVYPAAYHAWTVPGLGPPRFYPQYGSTRKCPFILFGERGVTFLVEGGEKPFDPGFLATCMGEGRGYTMAYDPSTRDRSTADALAFLLRQLQP